MLYDLAFPRQFSVAFAVQSDHVTPAFTAKRLLQSLDTLTADAQFTHTSESIQTLYMNTRIQQIPQDSSKDLATAFGTRHGSTGALLSLGDFVHCMGGVRIENEELTVRLRLADFLEQLSTAIDRSECSFGPFQHMVYQLVCALFATVLFSASEINAHRALIRDGLELPATLCTYPRVALIQAPRRFGKTFLVSRLAAAILATRVPVTVAIVAQNINTATRLQEAITNVLRKNFHLETTYVSQNRTHTLPNNNSYAVIASSAKGLRGKGEQLWICDEANFIPESALITMLPILLQEKHALLALSSPADAASHMHGLAACMGQDTSGDEQPHKNTRNYTELGPHPSSGFKKRLLRKARDRDCSSIATPVSVSTALVREIELRGMTGDRRICLTTRKICELCRIQHMHAQVHGKTPVPCAHMCIDEPPHVSTDRVVDAMFASANWWGAFGREAQGSADDGIPPFIPDIVIEQFKLFRVCELHSQISTGDMTILIGIDPCLHSESWLGLAALLVTRVDPCTGSHSPIPFYTMLVVRSIRMSQLARGDAVIHFLDAVASHSLIGRPGAYQWVFCVEGNPGDLVAQSILHSCLPFVKKHDIVGAYYIATKHSGASAYPAEQGFDGHTRCGVWFDNTLKTSALHLLNWSIGNGHLRMAAIGVADACEKESAEEHQSLFFKQLAGMTMRSLVATGSVKIAGLKAPHRVETHDDMPLAAAIAVAAYTDYNKHHRRLVIIPMADLPTGMIFACPPLSMS